MSSFVKSFLILFASLGGHRTIGASCGGVLTNSSGIIMSPGFPKSYANDLSCDWDIICPEGNKIILTFTDIDVEHAGSNCFDSIKIFENINASSTYEVCEGIDSASDKGSSILLSSSTVRIRFTSDSTVTRKGFMANYTFVPNSKLMEAGQTMKRYLFVNLMKEASKKNTYSLFGIESDCVYEYNTSSGIVLSPNYAGRYPSNIQCIYSFSFGANQLLSLRFLSFELEKEVKDGSCSDFVRLRNADFKIYGEFCGKTLPRSFSFYYGKAWMMFSSDKTKTEAGFSLAYEVKNITECLQDPLGESYAGQINVTSNGSACARWDSTLAMKNGFSNLIDQENYCRNPNNQPMPWCFNAATELPEYCNISFCDLTTSTEKTTTTTTATTTTTTTTTKPITATITTTTPTTTTPTTTTKTQTPTILSTTTTQKNNLTEPESMVLSSTKVSTDFIIIVIVVPVLLLILIFGVAIAVVRFLVKKKKMSAPITQLRSIVNPNYVSKDSVVDGYIEALENDEISRQSIVAAHESVLRMSRKYSRSQPADSVYQSLEDVAGSGTLERKQSSKEESPYVEATNTYDVLRQKRGKKVDPNDFKTYSEVSIISEGNENYDHTNTTSRVFENDENQEIYTNTPSLLKNVSVGQRPNDAHVKTTKMNKMKNEMPSYATLKKKRHSSFVSPKPVLPESTSARNIRFSTGEKFFQNPNKSIGENENDQPIYSQPDKTRGMLDDVLSVLDKSEKPNSDDGTTGGSNEQPMYATVHKTRQGSTKDPQKSKVPDPKDLKERMSTSGELGGNGESEIQQQQDKAIASVAPEEEEAIYEEPDVQYDQLRRQRTRRNRNLGVKVSIYSEILPDTSNDEGIYSNTESGRRMIKSEQVMVAKPPPSADESVIKTVADSESPAEPHTNETVIESSRL